MESRYSLPVRIMAWSLWIGGAKLAQAMGEWQGNADGPAGAQAGTA